VITGGKLILDGLEMDRNQRFIYESLGKEVVNIYLLMDKADTTIEEFIE